MNIGVRESCIRGTKSYPVQIVSIDATEPEIDTFYHWHPEFEIIYVEKGGFTVNVEGEEYNAEDGDLFFISPDSPHSLSGGAGKRKLYHAIVFFPSLFSFFNQNDIQDKIIDPLVNHKIKFPPRIKKESPLWEEVYTAIGEIVSLNKNPPHRTDRMKTTLLFLEVLLMLWEGDLYSVSESENFETERIRKVVSFIEKNFRGEIKLRELAEITGLSEKYFCSFFKLHTEKTPVEYINCVRINSAASKLKNTDDSITEIAFESGFENVGYFIRRFKAQTGMTPGEWRKMKGEK
ncbi:MAG: AraC family transcriptional regulator [Clostridia bacterium]|nr:AraC family transcriptional regulator [Clostridia bacterium]